MSGWQEWRTPPEFFNKLDNEFHFTVDVAATDENTLVLGRYCTKATDGLSLDWILWGTDWGACECLCHQSNALIAANKSQQPLPTFLLMLEDAMAFILGVEIASENEHAVGSKQDGLTQSSAYDYFKRSDATRILEKDANAVNAVLLSRTHSGARGYLQSHTLGIERSGRLVKPPFAGAAPTVEQQALLNQITLSPSVIRAAQERCFGTSFPPATLAISEKERPILSPGALLSKLWSAPCPICSECAPRAPAIFVNPPYNNQGAWVRKGRESARQGATVVLLLLAGSTDTAWFHECVWDDELHRPRGRVELRLIRGRLRFHGDQGTPIPSPRYGNMLVIFHPAV